MKQTIEELQKINKEMFWRRLNKSILNPNRETFEEAYERFVEEFLRHI